MVGAGNGSLYQIATATSFVTSLTAGSGISLSGSAGGVTVTNSIGYPFPGNATSTTLTFGGGLVTGTSTIGSLTATGTVRFLGLSSGFLGSSNGTLYTFASSSITAASSSLLGDANTLSGANTFTQTIAGNISGNAGTVTNGVYTTTFGGLFDNRLSATTSLPDITTLSNLASVGTITSGIWHGSVLGIGFGGTGTSTAPSYGQLLIGDSGGNYEFAATSSLGLPTFASLSSEIAGAYPFPNNSTSTLLAFTGGLASYASTTVGNGTQAGGLTISGGATTTLGLNIASSTLGLYLNGVAALEASTTRSNFYFGGATGVAANAGSGNYAIGKDALLNATSSAVAGNFAVGFLALGGSSSAGMTGNVNNALGEFALGNNTTGSANNALGANALGNNITGSYNNALGDDTLGNMVSGSYNNAMGFGALQNNSTGSNNNAFGPYALYGDSSGSNNTAIGYSAGYQLNGGYSDIVIGDDSTSLAGPTFGHNEIALGANAFFQNPWASNQLNIGNLLYGVLPATTTSFQLPATGAIGIGTSSPYAELSIMANNGSTQQTLLAVGASTASATTTLFDVLSSGNVGVGTTTPDANLDLYGSASQNGLQMEFTNNAATQGHHYDIGEDSGSNFSIYNQGNVGVFIAAGGNGWSSGSDQRLKTNIETISATSGLSAIMQLDPVTYNWLNTAAATTTQLGFIAQQMQQVFPELVSSNGTSTVTLSDGSTEIITNTLGINYTGLIAPTIAAVQDIANISGIFEQNLIAWLGNAQNGIGDFFAKTGHFDEVQANELCAGTVCVDEQQLAALLAEANAGQPGWSVTASNATSTSAGTPPVIQVNGDNPAIVQVGATYNDLGATIIRPQADLNLGIQTYLNGSLVSPVQIDTSQAATDTIDYVVTDQNGLTSTSTRTIIVEAPSIVPSDNASSTATTLTAATSTSSAE